jgi:hypothetical protein
MANERLRTALLQRRATVDEIAILVYSGFLIVDATGLLEILAKKASDDVRIRILLGDPDSPQVGVRGQDEGIDELMASKIRNVLVVYGPLRRMDGVEVRLHDTVLYNSIYPAAHCSSRTPRPSSASGRPPHRWADRDP